MSLTLISLYADLPGTDYYRKAAAKLTERCCQYGVTHCIEERESAGSWLQNVHLKPFFIREKWRELGPVLWVDVDSALRGNPVPLAAEAAKGYDAIFPKCAYLRGKTPVNPVELPGDCMHATIFTSLRIMGIAHVWNNTKGAGALLDRWCGLCGTDIAEVRGDHRCLQLALDELTLTKEAKWGYLPEMEFGKNGTLVSLGRAVGVPGRGRAMNYAKNYCNKIRRNRRAS
jgi:hypothetical protein